MEQVENTEELRPCEWCGELFEESELQEEADLGMLCHRCVLGINSHGEELFLKH